MTDAMPWDNVLPGPPRNFVSDGIQYHTTAPAGTSMDEMIEKALREKAEQAIRDQAKELLREMEEEAVPESDAKLWIEVDGQRYYSSKVYDAMVARAEAAEKILQVRSANIYAEGYKDCSDDVSNAFGFPSGGLQMRKNPYDERVWYQFEQTQDPFVIGVRIFENGIEKGRSSRLPAAPAEVDAYDPYLPGHLREIDNDEPPF